MKPIIVDNYIEWIARCIKVFHFYIIKLENGNNINLMYFKIQNKQSDGKLLTEEIKCTVESTDTSSGDTILECTGNANINMQNINSLTGSNSDYSLTLYVKDWQILIHHYKQENIILAEMTANLII